MVLSHTHLHPLGTQNVPQPWECCMNFMNCRTWCGLMCPIYLTVWPVVAYYHTITLWYSFNLYSPMFCLPWISLRFAWTWFIGFHGFFSELSRPGPLAAMDSSRICLLLTPWLPWIYLRFVQFSFNYLQFISPWITLFWPNGFHRFLHDFSDLGSWAVLFSWQLFKEYWKPTHWDHEVSIAEKNRKNLGQKITTIHKIFLLLYLLVWESNKSHSIHIFELFRFKVYADLIGQKKISILSLHSTVLDKRVPWQGY